MSHWTATTGTLVIGCGLTLLYIGRRILATPKPHPLPPGPPGLPWIGNVFGIDPNAPWVTYAEWAKTYGDVVYSRLFGRDIIIINSEKVAEELLEKRSTNYSDRPCFGVEKILGLEFNSVLMPYGDRWDALWRSERPLPLCLHHASSLNDLRAPASHARMPPLPIPASRSSLPWGLEPAIPIAG